MITVYGADWCEDTRRSQRLLRRLHVPHHYVNIDEDLDALERQGAQPRPAPHADDRSRPGGEAPRGTRTTTRSTRRWSSGDADARGGATSAWACRTSATSNAWRRPRAALALLVRRRRAAAAVAGRFVWLVVALTGHLRLVPAYHAAGVTSLGGPGDRPDEAERAAWVVPRARGAGWREAAELRRALGTARRSADARWTRAIPIRSRCSVRTSSNAASWCARPAGGGTRGSARREPATRRDGAAGIRRRLRSRLEGFTIPTIACASIPGGHVARDRRSRIATAASSADYDSISSARATTRASTTSSAPIR